MIDHQAILFAHVAATLPDSISGQKQLLSSLKHVLTRNHPARATVVAQLERLEAYERHQAELPFKFNVTKAALESQINKLHGKDGQ